MKMQDMTLEQLQAKLDQLNTTREELFAQKEPIDKKLVRNYGSIEKVKNLIAEKKYSNASVDDVDWASLLIEGNGNNGISGYELLEKLLKELGLRGSGYMTETQQRLIQISVASDASDEDIDKIEKGIQTLLPHIIAVKDYDFNIKNAKSFDLMENSLSEYGSYSIRYDADKDYWNIVMYRYHSPYVIKDGLLLRPMLEYIRDYHPYPDNRPRRDYDYD